MRVLFTRPSRQDLVEIGDWIAADNPRAAARTADRLVRAAEALSKFPLRYPEMSRRPVRKRVVGDYVILYRVRDDVEVLRILHSARDWLSLLDDA